MAYLHDRDAVPPSTASFTSTDSGGKKHEWNASDSLGDLTSSSRPTTTTTSPATTTTPTSGDTYNTTYDTTTTTDHIHIPPQVCEALDQKGLYPDRSGVVHWKHTTHHHPRQWPLARKTYDSAVICLMEFIMTLASNIGSSVVPYARASSLTSIPTEELGVFYFTTLYLFGQAFGGLIFPPLAESFGGRTIYTSCTVGFAACCVLIGACPSVPAVVVGRFVSGALSAMPAVVAAGSIENMWDVQARIWLVHMWICSAVLALALAPAVATLVGESRLGWQWLFYITAILSGVLTLLCSFMRESRPSQLLRLHVRHISHKTNFPNLSVDDTNSRPSLQTFVQTSLTMPMRLFCTEPIVVLTSIMGATVYGIIYLFTAAMPKVYQQAFGFTTMQGSLVFVSIAVGVVFTLLPRIYDVRVSCRKSVHAIEPEDKLFGFYVAAPVLAIGLWWFSLTVPPFTSPSISPWISITSLALFGYSVVEFDNVLSGYLCDTYASRTASAIAPMNVLRAILSGTFPLFGAQMFRALGANNAMFVLAAFATFFCAVAALFKVYGKRIRERSPFAELTAHAAGEADMGKTETGTESKS